MAAVTGTAYSVGRGIQVLEKLRAGAENLDLGTAVAFLYVASHPGITVGEVQKLGGFGRSAASRHLQILTERGDVARNRKGLGLIETRDDERDSRVKHCVLSSKGQALARELQKVLEIK